MKHYFATTAFGWAKAPTKEEAIAKVAKQAGATIIKANVKAQGGLYVWWAEVAAPQETNYGINYFQPVGVEITVAGEANITNAKGAFEPINAARKVVNEMIAG